MIAYRGVYASDLPSPDEALAAFFALWTPPVRRVESVALDASLGRILANDVRSATNVPEHARSAMDGFALRAADVAGAAPDRPQFVTLAGEARPGALATLPERSALRIATGAPLPLGADAVVRVEDVFADANAVGISRAVAPGADVVAAGEDIRAGCVLARGGSAINAATIGVLAALGHERIDVLRRPAVALITTGDEVVPLGARPRAGEVRNSNAIVLSALIRSFGVDDVSAIHVHDDAAALHGALADALREHDAVVTSGGSSVGARDFTAAAVSQLPPPGVIVHGVRMKPGRPMLLAASGSRPIIGLPGNPTAAMLALMAFGPAIFAKAFGGPAEAPSVAALAAEPLAGTAGWTCYVPVRIDSGGGVRPVQHFCSTFVSALVAADGYVRIDGSSPSVESGELVRVYRLP